MRADGLAQTSADFRRFRTLTGGIRTTRLKSGAGKLQPKRRPRRAESYLSAPHAAIRPSLLLPPIRRRAHSPYRPLPLPLQLAG